MNSAVIPPASPSPARRILLIGWDAADWQMIDPLIEEGRMPHLARLIEGGVMASLATLHPIVSPMLWTSIATGKTADKHGIHGFTERDPGGGARMATSTSRRAKALWNIFQQALGWRCHVVAWWASYPAEPLDGVTVASQFFNARREAGKWQMPPHAVHPPGVARELLPLLVDIAEIDDSLVLPFIPHAAGIDQKNDDRLETFSRLLADCCSVQAVATGLMERGDWDFTAVYFDAIDHFAHGFMPFHPPRMEHVPEADFEVYKDVMNGVYQLHDMMLGSLVERAGPETTIVLCSDHGFQSRGSRPHGNPREPAGPVLWHREFGILVMNGPGLKRDERIYGATLLDVAPTLLTLAGLPVGRDMDGKPLLEALLDPATPEPIPSWEDVPGRDGRHPPGYEPAGTEGSSDELLRQFAALGYINDPGEDREKAGADAERENQYNLAAVYLSTGHWDPAVGLLEGLVAGYPWETRYIHQLANAYLKAGQFRAAHELLDRAYPLGTLDVPPPIVVLHLWAKAKLRLRDFQAAAEYLHYATEHMLVSSGLWVENGWLWLELGALRAAERAFRRAVELDADAASAFHGMAHIHLRRRENTEAIDAALQAVQRLYHLPRAHLCLGVALAREQRFDEALLAFQRAVQMNPEMIDGHRWLAAVYAVGRPDSLRAGVHRNLARRFSGERARKAAAKHTRAQARRPIPELPPASERERLGNMARPLPVPAGTSGRTLVVVSGLPRSGTSLMMQMLAAGGLPPKTDGERTADEDNPEGYLEWEAIKRVAREPQLLDEPGLERQAIKVVTALLPSLPRGHRYKVIFMSRPVEEIVRSQAKMIARRGSVGAEQSEELLAPNLQKHRDDTLAGLRREPKVFEVLEVDYPALVADPATWATRVAEFVGADRLPQPERLAGAVRTDLHRNRAAAP